MIQFFAPDIENDGLLPEEESAHCVRVLRHKSGDRIHVTDGQGKRFLCEIDEADARHTRVRIISDEILLPHWGCRITLAVAPTKNSDRMEWLFEKAVEIGVDEIVLLRCEHSERKNVNLQRLRRILVSAMKQSLKTTLPVVKDMITLKDFVACCNTERKYFGYCDPSLPKRIFASVCRPSADTTVMIGPEGDFSPVEVKSSLEAGFIPVSFGESRLRTETAALFALGIVHTVNQISQTREPHCKKQE